MTRYKNHLIVALSITVVGLKRELLRRNWNFYEYNILLSNEQKWILALGRWDKKERKKEKKNQEKWKRNVPFKNIDERYSILSVWRRKLRNDKRYPRSICRDPSNYPSSPSIPGSRMLMILGTRGGPTVCRIFALFCRCLLEECRRAEPDRKAGLTWQLSCPCLLYDNSAIFAQTRRTSSKEQTNY